MRAAKDRRVRREYMPALVVATLFNTSLKFKGKWVAPEMFMPSMQGRRRAPGSNLEKMMAIAKATTLAKGGTVGGAHGS